MNTLPPSLQKHRVRATRNDSVVRGTVRYAPAKSLWLTGMAAAALVGGVLTFSWSAVLVFLLTTGTVLLFGHSLGSHRKLIHDSYQCPKWLEYTLVYCGVQVGLAGPLGLLRQHELRDYAQRLPDCHDFLRHGSGFWRDGWWQLHCDLHLDHPPQLTIEPRIAQDRFYRFLEATWMVQQLPPALLLYALGGWGFVFWGTCARVTAGVLGHWLIGYFAHNRGGMHYEVHGAAVQGRNIRFTSLLTMGESWHNNHHAFPGSARLGLFAGEWDPGWWALMAMRRIGWVWALRLPAALPARPELHACSAAGSAGVGSRVDRPGQPARIGLRRVMRLCHQGMNGVQRGARLEGPAACLPVSAFRHLAGPRVEFVTSPRAMRLVLHMGALQVQGLPALCVALSQRGHAPRILALCLAPLAVGFEAVRNNWDTPTGLH